MIKHLNVYKISNKVGECKMFVKSFGGAKIPCMKDCMKPKPREKPEHVLLHVGTNYLNSDREQEITSN